MPEITVPRATCAKLRRAHNPYEAEQAFGAAFVQARREQAARARAPH